MRTASIACTFSFVFSFASPALLADGTLASRSATISEFLSYSESSIDGNDRQRLSSDLLRIETILDYYGFQQQGPRLFKLRQDGDKLEIYSAKTNTLLLTWNKHDQIEVRGPVIALLDSGKEFAAYKLESDKLVPIVVNWQKTVQFAVQREYIGLLDSDRIAEVYSIEQKKQIVGDWKNAVTALFEPKYIVLLDDEADKNLEVYDTQGAKVIHFKGVTEVHKSGSFEITYTQNGVEKTLDLHDYLGFGSHH